MSGSEMRQRLVRRRWIRTLVIAVATLTTALLQSERPTRAAAGVGSVRAARQISAGGGWALTSDGLWWTANDGQQWNEITPAGLPASRMSSVAFFDRLNGWIVAKPGADQRASVWVTVDGGVRWEPRTLAVADGLSSTSWVHFVDRRHGWVLLRSQTSSNFSAGRIFATADGGLNWNRLPDPPTAGDFVFFDPATGWLADCFGESLFVTRDAGRTWSRRTAESADAARVDTGLSYQLPEFTDPLNGTLAAVSRGTERSIVRTYRTRDGGDTWLAMTTADVPVTNTAAAVSRNADTVIVSRGNAVTVGSDSWTLADDATVASLDFISADAGWVTTVAGRCRAFKADCYQDVRLWSVGVGRRPFDITPSARMVTTDVTPLTVTTDSQDLAFDRCTAATVDQMRTWWNESPYGITNIYFGGAVRSCSQPTLTTTWVSSVLEMGWGVLPTWVGPQAPCVTNDRIRRNPAWVFSTDPVRAAEQGRTEAVLTAAGLASLGLGSGTVVYYDLEFYSTTDLACLLAVRSFVDAWVGSMHELGLVAGLYAHARTPSVSHASRYSASLSRAERDRHVTENAWRIQLSR